METSFLSASARTGIQRLKTLDTLFNQRTERLATGRKVNSAKDDPTAFFTARSLNNRASDLNRVVDGIGISLSTVKAAEVGVRALQSLVRVAQGIVDSAASLPVAQPTATGTVNVAGQNDLTALAGVNDGDQISVQVGTAAATTITINSDASTDDLVAQLNAIENVEASVNSSGALQISTTNGEDLTLSDASGAALAGLGVTAGTFDQSTAVSPARAAKAAEFNAVLTQINQLAGDASFLGVNLLNGDSPVLNFNENGTSSLVIQGSDSSASGLGIAQAANGFGTNADIASARADLKGGLDALRNFSSRLSSEFAIAETRRSFTSQLSNVLQAGADNLTLADSNEEGVALLALQARKSFASASFSVSQGSERGVLSLFA